MTVTTDEALTAGEDYTIALATDLSGNMSTNITFDADGYAAGYITSVNGSSSETWYLYLSDGTLYLTNDYSDEYYWEGGNAAWNSVSWSSTDGSTASLISWEDGNKAFFTGGSAEVTLMEAVSAKSVTVSGGTYTFSLSGSGSLEVTKALTVGDENGSASSAEFNFGLALSGAEVVIYENGVLTVNGAADIGELDNSGTLTVSGALTLGAAAENGGTVRAASLSVTGDNTFTQLTVTGTVSGSGALTVGGSSSVGSLSGVTSLEVSDTLTVGASAGVETLAGAGTLTVNGNLELTAGESAIGTLSAESLTLASGASLTVTNTLTATEITLNALSRDTVYLTAGALAGGTVNFSIEGDVLGGLGLAQNETISVAALGDTYTGTLTLNGENSYYTSGDYTYYITAESGAIVITASLSGSIWDAAEGGTWGESGSWMDSQVPGTDSTVALFTGEGSSVVTIGDDVTGVSTIYIAVAEGAAADSYTFEGGSLSAESLKINSGNLTIANDTSISGSTEVTGGTLTVADGGALSTEEISVEGSESSVSVAGELTVGTALTVADSGTVTVESGGTLSAAEISVEGSGSSVSVAGELTVGTALTVA
ncbi:MAG: hypothetical protein LIO91_04420, partial [Bacteroidales bacterium]|nr:hypothetical protein [Bacteroidales bacterium]